MAGRRPELLEDATARRLSRTTGEVPDLIEELRERNIQGRLWELPGVGTDKFPG
jgi:hypothetical protein